jgi:RimJ/RimL family protein N-acetyltransferase
MSGQGPQILPAGQEQPASPFPDILETARLVLRKPRLDDVDRIASTYAKDPEVTRYILFRPDQTAFEIEAFLHKALAAWDRGSVATWGITIRETRALIGMIDLRIEAEANLGYVIDRPYWNLGLMTEAVRCVTHWAFTQEGIHRVWAVCEVNNAASARVLEKAGFVRMALLTKHLVFPNLGDQPRDCYRYDLFRS